jgi:hypothetical protein
MRGIADSAQVGVAMATKTCYWLLRQALCDSDAGRFGPLFNRMTVNSGLKKKKAGHDAQLSFYF